MLRVPHRLLPGMLLLAERGPAVIRSDAALHRDLEQIGVLTGCAIDPAVEPILATLRRPVATASVRVGSSPVATVRTAPGTSLVVRPAPGEVVIEPGTHPPGPGVMWLAGIGPRPLAPQRPGPGHRSIDIVVHRNGTSRRILLIDHRSGLFFAPDGATDPGIVTDLLSELLGAEP